MGIRFTLFITLLIFITSCFSPNGEQQVDLSMLRNAQAEYELATRFTRSTEVKYGQGLFQTLENVGIRGQLALGAINILRDKIEFSKLKVGDKLSAHYSGNGDLIGLEFSFNPAESHRLTKEVLSTQWDYSFHESPTIWKERIITGSLSLGSTLQAELKKQGLDSVVVGEIVNVLLCKVNFRLDARNGDQFKVLLKERYFKNQILATKILYTSYEGRRVSKSEAYYYEDDEEGSTFTAHYTEDGEALIRSGLRYPLKRLHIRSGYGVRRHPVTGRKTMHRGVDLRARRGDPVYAVAKGIVVESKFTELGGNKVAIKHNDNSVSYYLHLDRRDVKIGQRVKSYQRIGSVGETGRVTGPHLHFGFRKPSGTWMNPMNKRMIATPKLKGEKYARLQKQIIHTKVLLNNLDESNLSQASSEGKDTRSSI